MKTNNYINRAKEERFEFIFYINNNIICQRYFNINNFNEDSVNSTVELKELMDNLIGFYNDGQSSNLGVIPSFLKKKSKEYLWEYYKPYAETQYEEPNKNIYEKIDNFQLEIRVDKKTLIKGEFSGNFFPPKVRYSVKIGGVKEGDKVIQESIIPQIISEIRVALSQKNYTVDDELVAIKDEINQIS